MANEFTRRREPLSSAAMKRNIKRIKPKDEDYAAALEQKENLRNKYVNNYLKENNLKYNTINVDRASDAFEQVYKTDYSNLYNELEKYQKRYNESQNYYHFGDITNFLLNADKKILNTGADLGLDILEGGLGYAEGGIDALTYLGADIIDGFGGAGLAKDLRSRADFNSTAQIFGKNANVQQNFGDWTRGIEEESFAPDFVDQIFQGVGQVATAGLTAGALGGSVLQSAGVTFASSYGNARSEAKRNGASDAEAHKAGLISAAAETLSEQFFDAVPGMKVEGWGSKLTGKLSDFATKYFGEKTGKAVLKVADSLGEGFEEILSNAFQAAGNDIVHYFDENYTYGMENQTGNILEDVWNQFTSSDSWQQFASAAITSAIVNGAKGRMDNATRKNIINAYAQDNNMSYEDAEYILTGEMQEQAKQEAIRDKVDYDSQVELSEIAQGRVYNYAQQTNSNYINSQIDAMEKARGQEFTEEERQGLFDAFKNRTEEEINSPERYRNFKLDEKQEKKLSNEDRELYESFMKNSNDTQAAHELFDFYKKLREENPNARYQLTSNDELVEMGLLEKQGDKYGRTITKDGKQQFVEETINGLNAGDRILINRDGLNAMEATTIHEIAHSIKDSSPEGYKSLTKMVHDILGEDDYNQYKEKYADLYGDEENLEDEYINDKLGELLNKEEFINKLKGNRNLLQRILDKVKELLNYVTSSGQKRQLIKMQSQLEKAYKELYGKAKFEGAQDAKYSLSQDSQGRELSKEQQEYFKDSKVRDDEGRLIPMYHGTPSGDFTIFHPGSYFSSNKEYAQGYENTWASSISSGKEATNPKTYEVYLNITNPFSIQDSTAKDIYLNEYIKGGNSLYFDPYTDYTSTINNMDEIDWTEGEDLKEWLSENHPEYDGLVLDEGGDGGYGGAEYRWRGKSYLPFNSNQIKNVGNTNPTSNPDIRYSLSQMVDSEGEDITQKQFDYFKNTKAVDQDGELWQVHHGSPHDFTIFDINKAGETGLTFGNGFYFTNSKGTAYGFTDGGLYGQQDEQVKSGYINIEKPASRDTKTMTYKEFRNLYDALNNNPNMYDEEMGMSSIDALLSDYGDIYNDKENTIKAFYDSYDNDVNLIDNLSYIANPTEMYKTLRDVTGYDGIIVDNPGGYDTYEKYFIAFNPDQFKLMDNKNPTNNVDMRFQLTQTAPQRGYGTYTEDITNNMPVREAPNLSTAQEVEASVEVPGEELPFYEANENLPQEDRMAERRRKFADERIKKMMEKQTYKSAKEATKIAKNYLGFNQKETEAFKNQITKLSKLAKDNLIKAKNYNDLKDTIRQYATKDQTFINQEIKDAQKEIRNTQLIVSDDLKTQITDWSDFRKSSGLNIRKGVKSNVDTIYEELLESYPGMLDSSITNYADQLQELSDFLKRDNKYVEHFELSEDSINNITNRVWEKLSNNALTKQEIKDLQDEITQKAERRTREVVQQDLLETMGLTEQDIQVGKDISSIAYQRTDPRRLNEKVFGYDVGQKINQATNGFVQHQEANKIRWQNKERAEIEDLGIKARSKMSAAVQKYGEKQYVNDKGELVEYNDQTLMSEFPNVQDQEKIKNAARVLRQKYDDYIDRMNDALTDMGYDPVPKRKDYFRHFMELDDKLSQFGFTFSKENIMKEDLPTDINGLTDQFKPGKNYFASAMTRKGLKTTYDAITGIDQYLEGVGNVIYHTESIQRYRALSKLIRETYGQTHGTDNIELMTPEEAEQRIQDIYDNKLSRYAAWLDEQANALAGKKAAIDRSLERVIGRKGYTLLNGLKKQVGSNMTGYNVRSAMTNFASAIQGASKTQKLSALQGFAFALKNYRNIDPLVEKSDFLATRFGTDALSKKKWQKMSEAGQVFMNATDRFTTLQIWGGKYFEGLNHGLSEEAAIQNADNFAARIMGDRSKGQTAEIFNSKTLGLLTQFQLEVNNQWSSMIHDNKMAMQQNPGLKAGLHIANQLGQLYAASWFFNNFMKAVTGSDVMFDPIDILMGIFNPDDEDEDLESRTTKALGKLVNQLPMASIFTGGRIPISEAFKGVDTGFKYITGQKDIYGNNYTLDDVKDDFLGSLAYYVMPTGYGQLKKTTQGLGMYANELPGSYTSSGRLRFEADTSPLGVLQSALFGQYASGEAREYFDKGLMPLTEKQIQEVKDVNLPVSEYREIRQGMKEAANQAKEDNTSQSEAKVDYIYNLPLNSTQKNILANNTLNRKEDVDISDYGKYGSLEEFDYANKNPKKYQTITQITNYETYQTYKDDIAGIKKQYTNKNDRKAAVFDYINNQSLNKEQKIMLYRMAGGYSIKNYEEEMYKYINGLQLSKQEKENIYKELFK